MPVTLTGLHGPKSPKLYELLDGREHQVDQSVHGNDFWQTDFDPASQTYRLTYNLPLDGKPSSTWVLKKEL